MPDHIPDALNEDLPHADPDLVEDVGLAFFEVVEQIQDSPPPDDEGTSYGPDEMGRLMLDALRRALLKVERIG